MSRDYQRHGACGACGRPATEAPSGKWWHDGNPCRARSQTMWALDDVRIRNACRFIPEGEPLPREPERWHMHEMDTDEHGIPAAFGLCHADHMETVREVLAREAEGVAS